MQDRWVVLFWKVIIHDYLAYSSQNMNPKSWNILFLEVGKLPKMRTGESMWDNDARHSRVLIIWNTTGKYKNFDIWACEALSYWIIGTWASLHVATHWNKYNFCMKSFLFAGVKRIILKHELWIICKRVWSARW